MDDDRNVFLLRRFKGVDHRFDVLAVNRSDVVETKFGEVAGINDRLLDLFLDVVNALNDGFTILAFFDDVFYIVLQTVVAFGIAQSGDA